MKKKVRATSERAAIYGRVSTGAQEEEGTSLDTQEEACREYAARRGWEVDEKHVYREVHTGSELWERPLLTTLREAIKRGEVGVVVVYAIDRLARDAAHQLVILCEADHCGVQVEFVTEQTDNTPEGQLIRFVRGYAAKVEYEKIRERTVRGKLARVRSGKIHNHSSEKYGYRRDKEAGVRRTFGPEAEVVLRIFRWIGEDGASIRSVSRRLNEEGVPPPSEGKRKFSDPSRQARWGTGVLHRILRDPAYKGETIAWRWKSNGRHVGPTIRPEDEWLRLPEGTTPPIVSAELWDAVQARLEANHGQATRNANRYYALRGRILCGVCGLPLYSCPEKKSCRTYRCSSRDRKRQPCGGRRVPADEVEAWVRDEVANVLRHPETVAAELERRREAGPDPDLAAQLETIRRELADLEKKQKKLISAFGASEDDSFPWELVEQEIGKAQKERARLQGAAHALQTRLAEEQVAQVSIGDLTAACERVAERLDSFTPEDWEIALDALAVRVVANGSGRRGSPLDWRLDGSLPLPGEGQAGELFTPSGRCGPRPPRLPGRA